MTEAPLHSAPFFLRGLARGIDVVVNIAMLEAAYQVSQRVHLGPGLFTLGETAMGIYDVGIAMLAMIAYTTVAERLGGASFGKFCCGLRAVTTEGEPIGLRAALIRDLIAAGVQRHTR